MKKFIALVALVLVSASTMMYAKKVTQQHAAQKEKLKEMQKEQNSVPKKRCRTWQPINKLYRL